MFSAVKFIAAAAIVALFGGFLLTDGLTTQRGDEMVPAAASAAPAALVTGTDRCTWNTAMRTVTYGDDGIERTRGITTDCEMIASDPRFAGVAVVARNKDCHLMPDRMRDCIYFGTSTMTNDDGAWECSWTGPEDPTGLNKVMALHACSGVGGYAGLSYVGYWSWNTNRDGDSRGLIYEGDLPPLLEVDAE